MKRLPTKLLGLSIFVLGLIGLTVSSYGQGVTSSAMNGTVTAASGSTLADVSITVVHIPSGTVYRSVTRANGEFGVNGLRVGGPYSVTARADGYRPTTVNELFTELGQTIAVDIEMASSDDIQELDEFVISGQDVGGILSANTLGASTSLNQESVNSVPVLRGSLNDFARFNPYASITEDDRNELTVAGQNPRFNNIQIDGVRTNDQFGLNSNGVPSFNNPVSTEAIEAITVDVSPYRVTESGFTGASINAVTKSGGNEFSGSLYTFYSDDKMRGSDVNNGSNTLYREWRYGLDIGGPIIKDKLFFYFNYEEFERTEAPGSPGFEPDLAAVQQVIDYGNNVLGLDFGTYAPPDAVTETDTKFLGKIDWNINDNHRLSLTYRSTEGENPNFGNFDDFGETALSSNFYLQARDEKAYTGQLFSAWTPDFSTEIRVSYSEFDQPTTFDAVSPQIEIDAFPGADGDPDAGELFFGTERFRHANNLDWTTLQITANGTWYKNDHTVTFGLNMEQSEYGNLFLSDSFGNFTFATLDDFLNDMPQFDGFRNTAINGQDPVARPDLTVWGFYLQDEWKVTPRLSLLGGVRWELVTADAQPPEAQGFEQEFGFKNNGSIDGTSLFQPRFGFNYALDEDRTMQIRGGIGLFMGRSPAVWYSNAFTNNGETSGSISLENGLVDYVQNDFDPNNPIISVDRQDSTPFVDVLAEDLKLPSVWRYNVAFDYQLPWQDLTFTAELLITDTEDALYVYNANQPVVGFGPDGRELYDDGGQSSEYGDVFVLDNTDIGKGENFSLQLSKPFRGEGVFGNLSYTWGKANDANPFTSSRAVSNWRNRAGFNFNQAEDGTSNFQNRHRILGIFGYGHAWTDSIRTTFTVSYEGRTGRPYSYAFDDDVNGDGEFGNDLFYVPTGPNDPLVAFDPSFPVAEFFDYLDEAGLSKFAGGPVDRASEHSKFVNIWDLKVVQTLPIWDRVYTEVFLDFKNFGNAINRDWGVVEEAGFPFILEVADAEIVNDQYFFTDFDPESVRVQTGRYRSRWNIQVGAKIKF